MKMTILSALPLVVLSFAMQSSTLDTTTFIVMGEGLAAGMANFGLSNVPLWTQFEYARAMFPTVALIELGYYEALNAAVAGDPTLLPNPTAFGATYGIVLAGLRRLQAQVIVTTIPNPLDTGYFNSPAAAAGVVLATPSVLSVGYNIGPQDYVTRNGLQTISNQLSTLQESEILPAPGGFLPLPPGSTLSAATAAAITSG